MNTSTKFCKDTFGKDIKQKLYRIITGSLLYLTTGLIYSLALGLVHVTGVVLKNLILPQ